MSFFPLYSSNVFELSDNICILNPTAIELLIWNIYIYLWSFSKNYLLFGLIEGNYGTLILKQINNCKSKNLRVIAMIAKVRFDKLFCNKRFLLFIWNAQKQYDSSYPKKFQIHFVPDEITSKKSISNL